MQCVVYLEDKKKKKKSAHSLANEHTMGCVVGCANLRYLSNQDQGKTVLKSEQLKVDTLLVFKERWRN